MSYLILMFLPGKIKGNNHFYIILYIGVYIKIQFSAVSKSLNDSNYNIKFSKMSNFQSA